LYETSLFFAQFGGINIYVLTYTYMYINFICSEEKSRG